MTLTFRDFSPGDCSGISNVPFGCEAVVLAELTRTGRDVLFIACDDIVLAQTASAIKFFAPDITCLEFPAWDCLPYDRVGPLGSVVGKRLNCLAQLVDKNMEKKGRVVITTTSASLQRVPGIKLFRDTLQVLRLGSEIEPSKLVHVLENAGFRRAEIVMETGEYAVRGGIVDIFPATLEMPVRLDFFGSQLETLKKFDPDSQRTLVDSISLNKITVGPVSEIILSDKAISKFRTMYRELFGVTGAGDPLYESISLGKRMIGMEHWLPLFHEKLVTLFDYLKGAIVVFDHNADSAREVRYESIKEYYAARKEALNAANTNQNSYHPVPPSRMFLDENDLQLCLAKKPVVTLSPYSAIKNVIETYDFGGSKIRDFSAIRLQPNSNLFDSVSKFITTVIGNNEHLLVATLSRGSCERLSKLLHEHGVDKLTEVVDLSDLTALSKGYCGVAVLPLVSGFKTRKFTVITEQDILGDRFSRSTRRYGKAENFITAISNLNIGDFVVHIEHGIARFDGLQTIQVTGAPHDCIKLVYEDDDKLFVPVENIEVLSRYGSEESTAKLDRLGTQAWQTRQSKLKKRVLEMATELVQLAALRNLKKTSPIPVPSGLFEEFCTRFPFNETEDQQNAIADVINDLTQGRPTDRLICGDVGFGKTEIALRAAFAVSYEGKQVAIITPTTLLCRQHYQLFVERFKGFPMRIAELSRLVSSGKAKETKSALAKGLVDIVIGTHALLSKDIKFKELGLLVIDEEQRFGVVHKERLKKIRTDIHVLTLSATPIPRTLQQALTGIRDMSLIATPPVDRLAVRTFVLPFDHVIIKEALMREKFRGGQSFYVCPRIADISRVEQQLKEIVPELKIGIAHGQIPTKELENTVYQFYDGVFDILLSTNIIESGLDLPSVNTIIIHRADQFGLAQLYQLRGRVGRSKVRAYAYMTLPAKQKITRTAERRLEVMQTLDSLGAGFSLASHDLDIRGAGNLLGDEQSGHIREVGVELYQRMLEEAMAEAKGFDKNHLGNTEWSPQITLGIEIMIPESYVSDLNVRMNLYRRLANLSTHEKIEDFASELIDRFGTLPKATENLLQVVTLKLFCRQADIEKIEAGPKGAVIGFRNDHFTNPLGLVEWLTMHQDTAKLRPDHKLIFMRKWDTPNDRINGVNYVVKNLAKIASKFEATPT